MTRSRSSFPIRSDEGPAPDESTVSLNVQAGLGRGRVALSVLMANGAEQSGKLAPLLNERA